MPARLKQINHRAYWCLFFVAMTILAFVVRYHVIELDKEVRREGLSSQVYICARTVLISVLDVETGLRGYEIVGKTEYLRPYHAGLSRLDSEVARLVSLTAHNTVEYAHAMAVRGISDEIIQEFSNQVAVAQESGVQAARDRFVKFPTKPSVDLVREHLLAIQVEEVRLIEEATDALNRQMLATKWLLNIFIAVSVFLLAAMTLGILAVPLPVKPVAPPSDPMQSITQ
jgi:methyl-accepting chemotaxis protein